MSRYGNNPVELKMQEDMYKHEKKLVHIHMIDGGNVQLFFEDKD